MTSDELLNKFQDAFPFAEIIDEIARQQAEYTERALAEIIKKYDFIVGSMELKKKLTEILPNGACIVYSPFIENLKTQTTVIVIKKFDIRDILAGSIGERREGDD